MRLVPALLAASVALTACEERQFVQPCPPIIGPDEPIPLSAPPFAQLRREQLRLRFETFDLASVPVAFELPDQRCPVARDPEQDRVARTIAHPDDPSTVERPDVPGEYTLHTSTLELAALAAQDPELVVSASVIAGPDDADVLGLAWRLPWVGAPQATVAFTANLEPPIQADVFALAATSGADLLVLNGDLTRPSVPESTWTGLAHDLAPATSRAVLHAVAGDRDLAVPETHAQIFLRWFGGQGRAGGTDRWSSVDLAGIRWIFLDGTDERLALDGSLQRAWLDRELADVVASPALREAVIVLHRGPYGLTDQVPFVELRDGLLPVLAERGVRLIVQGSGHVFEHFEVGGLTVLTEGGGGAPLGDPDHRIERDPDAAAARVSASATHGVLLVDVTADGAIGWRRLGLDGAEVASGSLPAPAPE